MKRRILASIMIVGLTALVAGSTSLAVFNDEEVSEDNTFTTGELDLQVDWEESYNGELVETQELTNNPDSIFDFSDIKPGDHGEATVSLHLEDNPGWIWMSMNQTANNELICTEPEAEAEGQHGYQRVLHLPMDDSTEDVAMGNDASLYGTTAYSTGKKGKSVSFNGDAYGVVDHKSDYEIDQGTVSLWVRTNQDGLNGHKGIIGKDASGNGNGGHIYVSLRDGEPNFRLQDAGNSYEIQSNSQLKAGEWHHIVASFGSQGQSLYVDGSKVASSSYEGGISNNTEPIVFGASPWASDTGKATPVRERFKGDLDDIKLYKKQFNPEKISENVDCGDHGELGEHLQFTIWSDDGDNVLQDDEQVLFNGTAHELSEQSDVSEGVLLDGDYTTQNIDAFPASETKYIGVKWRLPIETGNIVQSDQKKFDIRFYTEQERHNPQTPEHPEEPEPTECEEPQDDSKEYTADEISQAKYFGYDFEELSNETKCEVKELFERQPFAEGLEPEDIMTRDEISQDMFEKDFDELNNQNQDQVEDQYNSQFE